MFSAGAWGVTVLPMALNCTAQWSVVNISSFLWKIHVLLVLKLVEFP